MSSPDFANYFLKETSVLMILIIAKSLSVKLIYLELPDLQ